MSFKDGLRLAALIVFCVLVVLWLLLKLLDSRRGVRLQIGHCYGVVGLKGGGKSLFVARLIAARLKSGVNVVANFPIEGCKFMQTWDDVILAPRGSMVILDEAHQWARASGRAADPLADWYVSHARKLGHEFWWVSQHEQQIAGFVKNQTNEMVSVQRVWRGLHRAKSWDPNKFRKKDARPLWAWWYSPRGAAIEVFDTRVLVRPSKVVNMTKAEADAHIESLIDQIEARELSGRTAAGECPQPPTAGPATTDLEVVTL